MEKYSDRKYPLTIISDRYGGTYSGGDYTAWPLSYWQIPDGPEEGDIECMEFWQNHKQDYIVGVGATAQEAADDLFKKMYAALIYHGKDVLAKILNENNLT